MKVAYLGYPTPYGLFSVYRNLRSGLAPHGIEVRWVAQGPAAARTAAEEKWASERQYGDVIEPDCDDHALLGKATVRHLIDAKYDAMFVNPPQGPLQLN